MTDDPTSARLSEIAKRHAKATPKLRHSNEEAGDVEGAFDDCGEERFCHVASFSGSCEDWANNSEFFVQAQSDIPFLLAQLSAADSRLKECARLMRELADFANSRIKEICPLCVAPKWRHKSKCVIVRARAAADQAGGK